MNASSLLSSASGAAVSGGRAASMMGTSNKGDASTRAEEAVVEERSAPVDASEEARVRLAEVLAEFDETGELEADLNQDLQTLRDVASASAESPLLDPAAALLGDRPRLSVPQLLGVGTSAPDDVEHSLDASLLGSVAGSVPGLVPKNTGGMGSATGPSALHQASTPQQSAPQQAVLAARASGASNAQPTIEWSVQTTRPAPSPLLTPASTPSASSGTFDASPWLAPGGTERPPAELPAVLKGGTAPQTQPVVVTTDGGGDAVVDPSMSSSSSARSTSGTARVAAPPTLAPNGLATAPEVPVMPGERPLTRLHARVSDGKRVLDVGVARESDGYAVEVRAPRDFVAEIREMEGDIDAALRDDGGDGLASFDASAEDEHPTSASESEPADMRASTSDDPQPSSDPRRMLDRRV